MKVLLASLLATACFAAAAEPPRTVCSITVNSPDEKEAFRKRFPGYKHVELVEKGRADWLHSACQKEIRCDALVVSGHFNAGETFYSDRIDASDHLAIDELERASCSQSCPGLFSQLKEVYLFGCESLNPDASKYASAYGESGRDRMRRVFAGVPVIYGFSAAAPVGSTAAGLLNRAFDAGAGVASGRPDGRLLAAFSKSSLTTTSGLREGDARFPARARVCAFYDERTTSAKKLEHVHALMRRDMTEASVSFARIEKLVASPGEAERQSPAWSQALAEISADDESRRKFLAIARAAPQPELRARMLAFAHQVAWLSPDDLRAENIHLIEDLLAKERVAYSDVDLACSLNRAGDLDARGLARQSASMKKVGHAALLACLDDEAARAKVLASLGTGDEQDSQVASAYLRHRPMKARAELHAVTTDITRMSDSRAQIRALDTLGRQSLSDRELLVELAAAFRNASSVNVQRALAELFIRSDPKALPRPQLVATLRDHRLPSPDGRRDLIDELLTRLQ
ncbi:hypothetical protein [Usitatibacter palustris]|uniref:HEAT repeat-containing protein n=1 Tax=Usitatibacter palustris TaxID=2732487 RepID=A0A6M4H1Q4_9PROT|nr:hypothetical protein [Usitatibacter palustris]QJR13431.1 hypothetical protein DSM104440_00214 [Usitatibacter palustris]